MNINSKLAKSLAAIVMAGSVFYNGCATTSHTSENIVNEIKTSVEFPGKTDGEFYDLLDRIEEIRKTSVESNTAQVPAYLVETKEQNYLIKEGDQFYQDMTTYMKIIGYKEAKQ
ncbi:hypothetical protein COU56_01355 [Candidatus Pacearchaeota archaeon CG10_big_fil_rev_8_21_14_0_10_31_9]|nr:MAG: hypothetical protein COU56_01355 [Candidatus Pacearchaeota archaeon CG10_big_fil_rev_8_21_14_0_10_31_9]